MNHRALKRFEAEEAKKQSNIEEITQKAVPLLKEESEPQNLDDDWVVNFFDKCRIVSDDEMQQLWSKVLAGEANTPGKFSKKTINLLSDLDKSDAELFKKFCGYAWMIGVTTPLIFDIHDPIYEKNGITFDSVSHLESLGLVQFNNIAGYSRVGVPDEFRIFYYGRPLDLQKQEGANSNLNIGRVLLTRAGQQLAEICGSAPVDGVYEYAMKQFSQHKYSTI